MAKILLVDDQPHNLRLMLQVIEDIEEDIQVITATTGIEALLKARRNTFDLVLMDIALPDMDGMQATIALREYDHLKGVPVVAVTACAMLNEEEVFRNFFADYVSKPIDEDKLSTTIRKWIGDR
jgi:CheY-like chemotaxis protein